MRASLSELHSAYRAVMALSWLFPEDGMAWERLEALERKLWRLIVERPVTTGRDARAALAIVRDTAADPDLDVGEDCTRLLNNTLDWLWEQT